MTRGILCLVAVVLAVLAAGGYYLTQRSGEAPPQAVDAPAFAAEAVWICPMHPQIREAQPGDCPICGMHLRRADGTSSPQDHGHAHEHDASASPPHAPAAETSSWICPMHAQIHQDHPGKCPICGMDLVPMAPAQHEEAAGVVVDTVLQQRLGVRLETVEARELRREIRSWGTVALDESARFDVSPKIDGWLRKLHVAAVGQAVQAGQPLYEFYSPDLVQRQREYIELLRRREQLLDSMTQIEGQNAQVLASLARERMRLRRQFENADFDKGLLDELERGRRPIEVVTVRAARSGVITAIGAREGSYITPQINVLSLAALSTVWIDIVLYPEQLAWVAAGDEVHARTQDGMRVELSGRLQLPNALLDARSRTVRGRLVASNPGRQLRPGTYVDVRISTPTRRALAVSRSALIRTGGGDKVMRASGDGRFVPTTVQTGLESDDAVEILSGLHAADQVAVKGQFLLDAAASLHAAAQRMRDDH